MACDWCLQPFAGVWPAMVKMDTFRQLCAGVHIPGWMKSSAVMTRGIVVAKESHRLGHLRLQQVFFGPPDNRRGVDTGGSLDDITQAFNH